MTSLFGFLPFPFLLPLLPNRSTFSTNHMDTNPSFSVCFEEIQLEPSLPGLKAVHVSRCCLQKARASWLYSGLTPCTAASRIFSLVSHCGFYHLALTFRYNSFSPQSPTSITSHTKAGFQACLPLPWVPPALWSPFF